MKRPPLQIESKWFDASLPLAYFVTSSGTTVAELHVGVLIRRQTDPDHIDGWKGDIVDRLTTVLIENEASAQLIESQLEK